MSELNWGRWKGDEKQAWRSPHSMRKILKTKVGIEDCVRLEPITRDLFVAQKRCIGSIARLSPDPASMTHMAISAKYSDWSPVSPPYPLVIVTIFDAAGRRSGQTGPSGWRKREVMLGAGQLGTWRTLRSAGFITAGDVSVERPGLISQSEQERPVQDARLDESERELRALTADIRGLLDGMNRRTKEMIKQVDERRRRWAEDVARRQGR